VDKFSSLEMESFSKETQAMIENITHDTKPRLLPYMDE